jgi:DHA1 family bicyclomycin/chloramphenicol resistance-like MFS transporter
LQHSITEKALPFTEFVALMAMMMSLVALSIDAMLPALPEIGADLGVINANDNQLVVALLFFGLACGQLLYGPMSDSSGRKPAVYLGFALFFIGSAACMLSSSLPVMLGGRFLQGLGLAGPRTLTLAIVRDQYQGRAMARVMSFVMTVFILVPMAAPAIGQGIMLLAGWRAIFGVIFCFALLVVVWFFVRHPETLPPARRVPFSIGRIARAIVEVCSHRASLGYTLAAGFIFSPFLGYLSSAQQVLQVQYGLGERFPLYFAGLALAIGMASFINARLVMRHGMRRICKIAPATITLIALPALVLAVSTDGHPPLAWFVTYVAATLFCLGTVFGSLNALAMEPLGHIAGVGAAVVGALSTFICVPLGILIGRSYDGTVLPLIIGFASFGALTLAVVVWAERGTGVGRAS